MSWVKWDELHVMIDMWLTDSDPILSVNSLFLTLWLTLCLTLFLSLEARLSDVMLRHEMIDMRSRHELSDMRSRHEMSDVRWVTWDRDWDEWETPWNPIPISIGRRTLRGGHKLLRRGWAEVSGNIMRWLVGSGHGQKLNVATREYRGFN